MGATAQGLSPPGVRGEAGAVGAGERLQVGIAPALVREERGPWRESATLPRRLPPSRALGAFSVA